MTERIRRKPYSVVLFDEIEKADPEVFNIMLQILDDGILTDSHGREADFKNSVIIMTSNVGASYSGDSKQIGFYAETSDEIERIRNEEKIKNSLKTTLRPEFLNRVDDIIMFNRLGPAHMERIVEIMLNEFKAVCEDMGIKIEIDRSAISFIAKTGYDEENGARPLRRAITRLIENEFAEAMLRGEFLSGDTLAISAADEKIILTKQK